MDKNGKKEISLRFRMFREVTGKTQKEISKLAGISQATISRMEAGEIYPPWELISFLHKNFNLDINWLITGKGDMILQKKSIDKNQAIRLLLEGQPINDNVKKIIKNITDPLLQNEMSRAIILAKAEPAFRNYFLKKEMEKEDKVMVGGEGS